MFLQIGSDTFTSQQALLNKCNAIKKATSDKTLLKGNDFTLLSYVLSRHPEIELPDSINNASIYVDTDMKKRKNRYFYIAFPNHEPIIVGLKKAVQAVFGKKLSTQPILYAFKIACRNAIEMQIRAKHREFKGDVFISELSGNEYLISELAIDHKPPNYFDSLLFAFIKNQNISPLDIAVKRLNGWHTLADAEFFEAWRAYHKKHAVLRAISKKENSQIKPRSNNWLALCTE